MIRNILAVIAGMIVGGVVNMALVMIGPMVIPTPAGVDMTTVEGMNASMHLLEPKHFVFPFLAHALGTLVGALVASFIAASGKLTVAIVVGAFFLLGGIIALDACLTTWQAIAYNAPRASQWLDWIIIGIAVLAPSTAACLLGWAWRHPPPVYS